MTLRLVASTTYGQLEGDRDERGMCRFRGIRYARAPIGKLRFRPALAPQPWSGIQIAQKPGPVAPQAPVGDAAPRMDEDCLFLNVTTPALDEDRRPVLVYIHAGAFIQGAGSYSMYSGMHLAADEDVVVVSINYRLGVLGFPPFCAFYDNTPQNLGLLDQVMALQWVRNNIAAFGGDPDNVTIFGYSAGGWSTVALMVMKEARGLFHRAVPQSGAFFYAMRPEAQAVHAERFLNFLGLDNASSLADMPIERLLEAQAEVVRLWENDVAQLGSNELDFPFSPLRDAILPDHPIALVGKGEYARVPLLIGTAADELGANPFRMSIDWIVRAYTQPKISQAIADLSDAETGERIWQTYERLRPDSAEPDIAGHIRSDWLYRVPAIRIAEFVSASGNDTWMYRFDMGAVGPLQGGKATHAFDMIMWFESMAEAPEAFRSFFFGETITPEVGRLSRQIKTDLAAFARHGRCNWPKYDRQARTTRIYDVNVREVKDPSSAERALWDGVV